MKVKRLSKNGFYRNLKLDKQTRSIVKWFNKIKNKMIADLKYTDKQ